MKFEIYFEYSDGTEDTLIVEAETIELVREEVEAEMKRRNAQYNGSKQLEE